jgi:hypothetical protein
MAHCTKLGVPPTKAEFLLLIRIVKDYINNEPPNAEWAALDTLADEIDHFEPTGRTWSSGLSGTALADWTQFIRNGMIYTHPHPRRYCINDNQRKAILESVTALGKRLEKIQDLNGPLPFSLTYIGWSRMFPTRRDQHYGHNGQNAVK